MYSTTQRQFVAFLWVSPFCSAAWNSQTTQDRFYTFQEFYTDAQYGPDFGYYSTGRIVHYDGPADNGISGGERDSQAWFNSYTTQPMSLSPFFGQMICDRLLSMWNAMHKPSPFFIVEFGGGTGMLARDILRQCRNHEDFFEALARYVIGERSKALRGAQKHTAAEFEQTGKLLVVDADARRASRVRRYLTAGDSDPVHGFVISNEVIDEFDPVRLRVFWRRGRPPSAERLKDCPSYREAYVLHRIDDAALVALLSSNVTGGLPGQGARSISSIVQDFRWEGQVAPCGLLANRAMQKLMAEVNDLLDPTERRMCAPQQVCCYAFVLAVDGMMQFDHRALQVARVHKRPAVMESILGRYRRWLQRINGTVPLTKTRYRELRRLSIRLGAHVDYALLVGGSELPGRIHTDEVFLALSAARCQELEGWRERNAERLAVAAEVRSGVSPHFDGLAEDQGTEHMKVIMRPGEAEFVKQAADLLDEGFMLTMDYGADAEAIVWHSLVHPHFNGIHMMDARAETADKCTSVSVLACPGLQDMTTSVDFTEVAEAGKRLGGWEPRAYGPIFLLELAFDPWLPSPLTHLIERAGGPRTVGLHAWYRKAEVEPWASFKVLVQHRGSRGRSWTLGAPEFHWPVQSAPRLLEMPSSCWSTDITKPPFAALITKSARAVKEKSSDVGVLKESFINYLEESSKLSTVVNTMHGTQQQAYSDLHLGLVITDYWIYLARDAGLEKCANPEPTSRAEMIAGVRSLATSRRLPELYGEEMFERVLGELGTAVFGNNTSPGPSMEPYVCMASQIVGANCDGSLAALAEL